ncbi:BREX system P-loop protein BrxC, partial [bacterium]|nr:BREX system P-loop protein BrxC [bacterium]
LGSIIFENIIRERKIRFDENKQDYPFSKKLDDKLIGREYELGIHIASPFHEYCGSEKILQARSMERDELLVSMRPDDRLYRDIILYKRTEKYCRQNMNSTQKETVKTILTTKITQNRQRLSELEARLRNSLCQAKLYVAGRELDVTNGDAQGRIINGFHELIKHSYPNLRMLQGASYSQEDVSRFIKHEDGLYTTDEAVIAESEQEVLSFIQSNDRTGIRTTLKAIVDKFEHKPNGWPLYAILCTLAKLSARGKIEVRSDANVLEDEDLKRALLNTLGYPNVVLNPQVEFSASQIRQLKEFYQDFFDTPPQSNETKALGKETSVKFEELYTKLTELSS